MLRKIKETLNSNGGFTLIEMMVVVMIIGILASIALPSFSSILDDSREARAKSEARSLYNVLYLKKEFQEISFTSDGSYDTSSFSMNRLLSEIGFDDVDGVTFYLDDNELLVEYPIVGYSKVEDEAIVITAGFVGTKTEYDKKLTDESP